MSTYRVELSPSAVSDLKKLDASVRNRVLKVIYGLARTPRPPGVEAIKGHEGTFRVRAGDWRIVYKVCDGRLIVEIIAVGHRREIYRRF